MELRTYLGLIAAQGKLAFIILSRISATFVTFLKSSILGSHSLKANILLLFARKPANHYQILPAECVGILEAP